MTVSMGISIKYFWKPFCYWDKRDHYDKLIDTRELLELLDLDCFNTNFITDTRTSKKDIHLLNEVDYRNTVYTCHDKTKKRMTAKNIRKTRTTKKMKMTKMNIKMNI